MFSNFLSVFLFCTLCLMFKCCGATEDINFIIQKRVQQRDLASAIDKGESGRVTELIGEGAELSAESLRRAFMWWISEWWDEERAANRRAVLNILLAGLDDAEEEGDPTQLLIIYFQTLHPANKLWHKNVGHGRLDWLESQNDDFFAFPYTTICFYDRSKIKEEITRLLDLRARLDARDPDGNTPLHLAAILEMLPPGEIIYDSCKDGSNDGVAFAAVDFEETIASFLLERGADPKATNNAGLTPSDLARNRLVGEPTTSCCGCRIKTREPFKRRTKSRCYFWDIDDGGARARQRAFAAYQQSYLAGLSA